MIPYHICQSEESTFQTNWPNGFPLHILHLGLGKLIIFYQVSGENNGYYTTVGSTENKRDKQQCKVCRLQVQKRHFDVHVEKHLDTRPLAGCNYCNYKGRSLASVRTHITWKHTGSMLNH